MGMTFDQACSLIEKCTDPPLLFGSDPVKKYRELAQLVHPDKAEKKNLKRANDAFSKMSALYGRLNGKAAASAHKIIGKWVVMEPLAKGDICDLYHAERISDSTKAIFKIARKPSDSDLVEQEYFALKFLHAAKEGKEFTKYLPVFHETLEASGRRANVMSLSLETLPLSEIMEFYPRGLDFRHAVWMVNRALSVLGMAHRCGLIHGAVLPQHLLYGPVSHSLTLIDWCYSVTGESKKHIPAIVKDAKMLYAPEVAQKRAPLPATDIYMLFASIKSTHAKIPKRFSALFDWCLAASPLSRPQDCWTLQDRWMETAQAEYGPPAYLKLEIPIT